MSSKHELFGRPITIVNQEVGSSDCVGCVGAMITGTTLDAFRSWVGETAPWDECWLHVWLLAHGFLLGVGFNCGHASNLETHGDVNLKFSIFGTPAVLVVESPTRPEDSYHVVLWNGSNVYDSLHAEPRELGEYRVSIILPLQVQPRFNRVFSEKILGIELSTAALRWRRREV